MNYPLRHISVPVPWHDTGWDGRVCAYVREVMEYLGEEHALDV
jgi:hypothetical protein